MTGLGEPYVCDVCHGEFVKTVSDEECMDEALDLYPAEHLAEGVGTVCDDCYVEVLAWAREHAPELLRE